ncbi:hypothetical protein MHYP_G00037290 [Metynnis hypsauchen]
MCVCVGGRSRFGSQVSRQAFRLPTWSKHHALTFLSSVSVGRDKSGLAAALAASCYLVTFQTVGVGGLSQAQAGLGEEAWPAAEAAGRCSGAVQMGLRDTPHPDPFLRELQGTKLKDLKGGCVSTCWRADPGKSIVPVDRVSVREEEEQREEEEAVSVPLSA